MSQVINIDLPDNPIITSLNEHVTAYLGAIDYLSRAIPLIEGDVESNRINIPPSVLSSARNDNKQSSTLLFPGYAPVETVSEFDGSRGIVEYDGRYYRTASAELIAGAKEKIEKAQLAITELVSHFSEHSSFYEGLKTHPERSLELENLLFLTGGETCSRYKDLLAYWENNLQAAITLSENAVRVEIDFDNPLVLSHDRDIKVGFDLCAAQDKPAGRLMEQDEIHSVASAANGNIKSEFFRATRSFLNYALVKLRLRPKVAKESRCAPKV